MIKSKEDYFFYREADRIALDKAKCRPKFFSDEIYRFQILLRKREYINNCKKNKIWFIYKLLLHFKYKKLSLKLGLQIPLNSFGPGLAIAHHGQIIVANKAKIGENCRIHEGVTIGATNGSSESAIIGNNVFIGSGAKIIGKVSISDNISIAANAVVVKDVLAKGITIGGIPAKKISDNDSSKNLIIATDIVRNNLNQEIK